MIYPALFWSFFRIGLFSVGGGYAAMPLIQSQVVELHGWLSMTQFADLMTIAEMTPGPIAINAATFVGMQVAGLPGAVTATVGCVTPSCVIVLALAYVYKRCRGLSLMQGILDGLRPAVVAMIAGAGLSLLLLALLGEAGNVFDPIAAVLFAAGFVLLRVRKTNPIWVIFGAGAVGIVLYGLTGGMIG